VIERHGGTRRAKGQAGAATFFYFTLVKRRTHKDTDNSSTMVGDQQTPT
jgi:hypothetical protein